MPKIIINEIDKTTAGQVQGGNFSVVVPCRIKNKIADTYKDYSIEDFSANYKSVDTGLYTLADDCVYYHIKDNETNTLIFDENEIYECSSQKDFKAILGKVAPVVVTTATSATYKVRFTAGESEWQQAIGPIDASDFYGQYKDCVYAVEGFPTTEPAVTGKYTVELDSTLYKLMKATQWTEGTNYIVITQLGSDVSSYAANGNQIAYELLGLGYTVLVKLIKTDEAELIKEDFWKPLRDKASYNFRYITTGGFYNENAYKQICDLATAKIDLGGTEDSAIQIDTSKLGRGDCIALIDVIEDSNFTAGTFVKSTCTQVNSWEAFLSKNVEIFAPKITYSDLEADKDFNYNKTFPASFHYLACAIYNYNNGYSEWFANAGYNRGVAKYCIAGTSFKLGDIAVNALQPRITSDSEPLKASVNLVIKDRNGYFMWGNRTAHPLNKEGLVASHFANIRQLCCTLKKEIYTACRKFTFDPNSDILWVNFCNTIRPTLETMKANQGISDYKIIKVKATKKALLLAKIRIVPIEAVEDFIINLYLEDSVDGSNIGFFESDTATTD